MYAICGPKKQQLSYIRNMWLLQVTAFLKRLKGLLWEEVFLSFFFLESFRCRQGEWELIAESPGFDWAGGQVKPLLRNKPWSRGETGILGLWASFYRLGLRWSRSGRIANLKEGFREKLKRSWIGSRNLIGARKKLKGKQTRLWNVLHPPSSWKLAQWKPDHRHISDQNKRCPYKDKVSQVYQLCTPDIKNKLPLDYGNRSSTFERQKLQQWQSWSDFHNLKLETDSKRWMKQMTIDAP